MCVARPECASLSFSPEGATCQLFRRVASYITLQSDSSLDYRFVRGRSGHHEFCVADDDCLQPDDRCLGKICHSEEHLTCRTLQHLHGVNQTGSHWGAVAGRTVPLYCNMEYQGGGWTLLVSGGGAIWNDSSALWRPSDSVPTSLNPYSIYQYADVIATSPLISSEDFFEIDVFDLASVSGGTWQVPRSESLLRSEPGTVSLTLQNGRMYGGWKLSRSAAVLPWLASAEAPDTFITLSPTPSKQPPEGIVIGSRPGVQKWGGTATSGYVAIFIKE